MTPLLPVLLLLPDATMEYDINGAKHFSFGDTVGIDAPGDSRNGCSFHLSRGATTCCYSCACQDPPCDCGPKQKKDPQLCDKSQSKHCREKGFNVTRVDNSLCVLFLSGFKRSDIGRYKVNLIGEQNQTVSFTVQGMGSDEERVADGFLVKTALNTDISVSAVGRLDRGCRFLFRSKDGDKTCCYYSEGSDTLNLCENITHNKACVSDTKAVNLDTRRSQCTLSLDSVREADSGTFTISFPADYSHPSLQGYKDKRVEVEVSCETHGLHCSRGARPFLEEAREYLTKCKACSAFHTICTGTGIQSELCTDEATTHLELSWDADHHLEATCYKPGDPTSEYNPDLMLGKAASTDLGGRVVCQESLPEMSCEDTGASSAVVAFLIFSVILNIFCIFAIIFIIKGNFNAARWEISWRDNQAFDCLKGSSKTLTTGAEEQDTEITEVDIALKTSH